MVWYGHQSHEQTSAVTKPSDSQTQWQPGNVQTVEVFLHSSSWHQHESLGCDPHSHTSVRPSPAGPSSSTTSGKEQVSALFWLELLPEESRPAF